MPRTITITGAKDASPISVILDRALKLLEFAGVKVDAAAQNIHRDAPPTATILLRFVDDKSRAIGILEGAGIVIQKVI